MTENWWTGKKGIKDGGNRKGGREKEIDGWEVDQLQNKPVDNPVTHSHCNWDPMGRPSNKVEECVCVCACAFNVHLWCCMLCRFLMCVHAHACPWVQLVCPMPSHVLCVCRKTNRMLWLRVQRGVQRHAVILPEGKECCWICLQKQNSSSEETNAQTL